MSATTDSIYRWCEYGFRVTEENKSTKIQRILVDLFSSATLIAGNAYR